MIHNYITDNQYWSVSHNTYGDILVQLSDSTEQVRLALSPVQAQELVAQLQAMIKIAQKDRELEFRVILPRENITNNMIFEENAGDNDIFLCNVDLPMWTTNPLNALHFMTFHEVLFIIENLKKLGFQDLYFDRVEVKD